jgi:hypothetical protein
MEKTKHTPGPWDRQNKGNVIGPSARHEVVAGINKDGSKYLPTICRMPGLSDEDYANARLITAAPDLLEAAKVLISSLVWERKRSGITYAGGEMLEAAIVKAEGRE